MITLENSYLRVCAAETGERLTLTDQLSGQCWQLDMARLLCRIGTPESNSSANMRIASARMVNESELYLALDAQGHAAGMRIALLEDGIEAELSSNDAAIQAAVLPGPFQPCTGSVKYLLPIMQGMLWDTHGEPLEKFYHEAGHTGFSMSMLGMLGDKGGLLVAGETVDDCLWWVGKHETGETWASNLQCASLGTLRYTRRVRVYLTQPTITAIAKRYRARVIEKGRFLSWAEKLEKRPALKRLFGALMCFIGYCQDDIDYVTECKKLKAYGFDKALIYPVRFNSYSRDFQMGGYPPIRLSREQVAQIKELGYDVAPWSWINEGLDDHTEAMRIRYRQQRDGQRHLGWQIDSQKWYTCCTSMMNEFQQHANATEFDDMTWDHFDVITCVTNDECYALDHPRHLGRPLDKTEDRAFIRELLLGAQSGQRAISSESFNDNYSCEYDLGSVKAWPQFGPFQYWPVPLTMLVYHDSMLHTWWEPHNYNSRYFNRDVGQYQYGGGKPALMAAMDALYGGIPDVFPFGAQYGWTGRDKETFLYRFRIEDSLTQFALEQARGVAQLHARIGMLEMTDFEILSPDGYVQRTSFADGTRVYANFGPALSAYIEGVGAIQSESYTVIPGEWSEYAE